MRKSLVLAALVLTILFANAQDNLQRGLVAYYPFNDNTNDESGNGNNGTKTNDIIFVDGKFGKAAKFGGFSKPGHIRVPNSSSLKFNNEATFAMWVKLDDASGMDGWGKNSATGNHCLFAKDHDRSGIVCTLNYSQNKLSTGLGGYEGVTGGGSCSAYNNGISGYSIGSWVHIVYVCDATQNTLYINGEKNNSIAQPFNFGNTNTRDLYFGKFSDSWYPFNGALDEIRIYNRALSPNEVSKLYRNDNSISEAVNETVTSTESNKEYEKQAAIQNPLKLKLPDEKYKNSTAYPDFDFKSNLDIGYFNMSFTNTAYASNIANSILINDWGAEVSYKVNTSSPVFFEAAYFYNKFTVSGEDISEMYLHGLRTSLLFKFTPMPKYLFPYGGVGFQWGTINGIYSNNKEVTGFNSLFWKAGIKSLLFNKFGFYFEYSQSILYEKSFNQFAVGVCF